jgi:6-pyruvoyl-tetrahydropterin synthase
VPQRQSSAEKLTEVQLRQKSITGAQYLILQLTKLLINFKILQRIITATHHQIDHIHINHSQSHLKMVTQMEMELKMFG